MIDHWYLETLYKEDVDGFIELVKILEDPDIWLEALVRQMNDD
jgi:hypothetical protein